MPTSSDRRPSIEIRGLGKEYALGEEHGQGDLREAITEAGRHPIRALRRILPGGRKRPRIWALRDLDLDVCEGEILGIVGPNGAGKTTLLRLLSRITDPTAGRFTLRGRTASLLAIGMGFHFEFTGRENIYLSGTILGMRKKEIDKRFDEIVAFSGVETFIDTPVKRYSSGMFVRLGFAVAAHLDAEILLVDEVLAVGDAAFRKRCLGAMNDVARGGRTVVFVSHDMGSIQRLCTRAILLDGGRLEAEGSPEDVVRAYLHSTERPAYEAETRTGQPQILSVELRGRGGSPVTRARASSPLEAVLRYVLPAPCPGVRLEATLLAPDATPLLSTSNVDANLELPSTPGEHAVRVELPSHLLLPGDFHLAVSLHDALGIVLDREEPALTFPVDPDASTPERGHMPHRGWVHVRCPWTLLERGP